jgi:hypothetical protein
VPPLVHDLGVHRSLDSGLYVASASARRRRRAPSGTLHCGRDYDEDDMRREFRLFPVRYRPVVGRPERLSLEIDPDRARVGSFVRLMRPPYPRMIKDRQRDRRLRSVEDQTGIDTRVHPGEFRDRPGGIS